MRVEKEFHFLFFFLARRGRKRAEAGGGLFSPSSGSVLQCTSPLESQLPRRPPKMERQRPHTIGRERDRHRRNNNKRRHRSSLSTQSRPGPAPPLRQRPSSVSCREIVLEVLSDQNGIEPCSREEAGLPSKKTLISAKLDLSHISFFPMNPPPSLLAALYSRPDRHRQGPAPSGRSPRGT